MASSEMAITKILRARTCAAQTMYALSSYGRLDVGWTPVTLNIPCSGTTPLHSSPLLLCVPHDMTRFTCLHCARARRFTAVPFLLHTFHPTATCALARTRCTLPATARCLTAHRPFRAPPPAQLPPLTVYRQRLHCTMTAYSSMDIPLL